MKVYLLVIALLLGGALAAQTEDDKRTVLQQCLDLPELQPYFHANSDKSRVPVIVENNGRVPVVSLVKFGRSVEYMTEDQLTSQGKTAYINFIRFDISSESASATFKYSAENIMVTVLLRKTGGAWQVTDSKLIER